MTMLATAPGTLLDSSFGEFMKKLFSAMALVAALTLPCFPQAQIRLSTSEQKRFDSYYSRWQSYPQTNNQTQVRSSKVRIHEQYLHYAMPANAPYGTVISWAGGTWR